VTGGELAPRAPGTASRPQGVPGAGLSETAKAAAGHHAERAGADARRYALRKGLPPHDADEVGQETAIEVYRRQVADGLEPIKDIAAYGMTVAKSKVIGHWRTSPVHDELPSEGETSWGISAQETDMLGDPNLREAVRFIQDVLTPAQSEVFYLRNVKDLTIPEIAEQLGIAQNTVKAHLKQAKKRLTKSQRAARRKLGGS